MRILFIFCETRIEPSFWIHVKILDHITFVVKRVRRFCTSKYSGACGLEKFWVKKMPSTLFSFQSKFPRFYMLVTQARRMCHAHDSHKCADRQIFCLLNSCIHHKSVSIATTQATVKSPLVSLFHDDLCTSERCSSGWSGLSSEA